MHVVVDSGCTWHVHGDQRDLINVRPCSDTVVGANEDETVVDCMGDLPILVRTTRGKELRLLLRGVRCSPEFGDTLISVDQLWATSRIDSVFRDARELQFHSNLDSEGEKLRALFIGAVFDPLIMGRPHGRIISAAIGRCVVDVSGEKSARADRL